MLEVLHKGAGMGRLVPAREQDWVPCPEIKFRFQRSDSCFWRPLGPSRALTLALNKNLFKNICGSFSDYKKHKLNPSPTSLVLNKNPPLQVFEFRARSSVTQHQRWHTALPGQKGAASWNKNTYQLINKIYSVSQWIISWSLFPFRVGVLEPKILIFVLTIFNPIFVQRRNVILRNALFLWYFMSSLCEHCLISQSFVLWHSHVQMSCHDSLLEKTAQEPRLTDHFLEDSCLGNAPPVPDSPNTTTGKGTSHYHSSFPPISDVPSDVNMKTFQTFWKKSDSLYPQKRPATSPLTFSGAVGDLPAVWMSFESFFHSATSFRSPSPTTCTP